MLLPLDRIGDRVGVSFADGAVTTPPGWRDAYAQWREGGWNAHRRRAGLWRARPAASAQRRLHRNVERRQYGLRPLPAARPWRDRSAGGARRATSLQGDLSAPARQRRMDRHDEPDRAAGRLRSRAAAHARGARERWLLPAHSGQKIFITYGEHDLAGQYRASGACAPARRAARHEAASRFSSRRNSCPTRTAPSRGATTCAAPASSTSSASMPRRPAR